MSKRVVSLALLVAYVTAADEMLARAATIDTFFQNATAPATWTVRSRNDLTGPITELYDKAKRVSRAHDFVGFSARLRSCKTCMQVTYLHLGKHVLQF